MAELNSKKNEKCVHRCVKSSFVGLAQEIHITVNFTDILRDNFVENTLLTLAFQTSKYY
jgi:hypothetical protein